MSSTKHRDTAGQTKTLKTAPTQAKPTKNTPITPHTGTEGSNPSLSAIADSEKTGQAGQKLISTTSMEGLGTFALPLTRAEFVRNLVDGLPVEIPRMALFPWLGYLQAMCSTIDVKIQSDAKIAQVTPHNVCLRVELLAWIDKNPHQLSQ